MLKVTFKKGVARLVGLKDIGAGNTASHRIIVGLMLGLLAVLPACSGGGEEAAMSAGNTSSASGGSGGTGGMTALEDYAFASRFEAGASAVAYAGQSHRQLLIAELNADIGALTSLIDKNDYSPDAAQDVIDRLNFYYETVSSDDCAMLPIEYITTNPELLQKMHGDLGCKNLKDKFAGNDVATDHKDWSSEFVGWTDWDLLEGPDTNTPEGLLQAFMATLAERAVGRVNGGEVCEPGSSPCVKLPIHLSAAGHDWQQLVQKLLLGAVTYSQGTDDYLGSDVEGKGLRSSNAQDADQPYSMLGHAWDEAFGYFGASREYGKFSDEEIASTGGRDDWRGVHDTNGDEKIDFRSEINVALSVNAAKRDLGGANTNSPTDFTAQAFDNFLAGRALIIAAGDTLTADEATQLGVHRDAIVAAWEGALAATIIHYVNEVVADMVKMGTTDYSYASHAQHWSELKGFGLGLQFNSHGKSLGVLGDFHMKVGDRPVLATATQQERDDYKATLLAARDALGAAMSFDGELVHAW